MVLTWMWYGDQWWVMFLSQQQSGGIMRGDCDNKLNIFIAHKDNNMNYILSLCLLKCIPLLWHDLTLCLCSLYLSLFSFSISYILLYWSLCFTLFPIISLLTPQPACPLTNHLHHSPISYKVLCPFPDTLITSSSSVLFKPHHYQNISSLLCIPQVLLCPVCFLTSDYLSVQLILMSRSFLLLLACWTLKFCLLAVSLSFLLPCQPFGFVV